MTLSPNKLLIKCGFPDCGHSCIREHSEYPPQGTPIEKIKILVDNRRRAMFCTGCQRYTIYVGSVAEVDHIKEKYNHYCLGKTRKN